jgi:hypothetical protein
MRRKRPIYRASEGTFTTPNVLRPQTYIFSNFENHFFSIDVVQKIRVILSSAVILFCKWNLGIILQGREGVDLMH